MSESLKQRLERIARETEAAETDSRPEMPLPSHVRVTRGNDRVRVLQIRLSDAEFEMLKKQADEQAVPASTLARDVLLRGLI